MRSGCGFRTFWIPAPVHQLSSSSPFFFWGGIFPLSFSIIYRSFIHSSLVFSRRVAMAKGDYKCTVLTGTSTYREWRAMFIAEWKSEKLWKYVDGSAIIPGPNLRDLLSTTATTETRSASPFVYVSEVEVLLDKKEVYELGFELAKKKCFMSVDKSHLATIRELSTSEKMFEALDKKYSATNATRLRQLFCDCQAISTQKNVTVMGKYEAMLNLNAGIRIQKPELAFRDKHLINFLLASMPSIYEGIIDNLNMRDTLTLDDIVRVFRTKETELTDLGVIKEESAHFATRGGFRRGRGGWGGARARTISRTSDGDYIVQDYSSRPAMNCFHCKKDGHGWRNCILYLAWTEEGKKWIASDKGKLWTTRGTTSNTAICNITPNTVHELALLAVAVEDNESEKVVIYLSSTSDHVLEASQLTSNKTFLHLLYSQVEFASVTLSPILTQPNGFAMITGIDLRNTNLHFGILIIHVHSISPWN